MRIGRLLLVAAIPLAILFVFFVLPVAGIVSLGFWNDGTFDPLGVLEVLARPRVHRVLWFTLWSATLGTLLSLALGLPAAHVLYRRRVLGGKVLRAALLAPFVLPTVVVGVAFGELVSGSGPLRFLNLDGSPVAIIAGLVFFNASVVIRLVGAAWESLDERPAQAAAALGASPAQVLRTVTLPSLRPAIVSAATVVFLFCATAFGVVLTLGGLRYSSVETEIYLLTTNLLDLQAAAALSVLQLAVVTGLLVAAARVRRTPDPSLARVVTRPRRLTRGDLPALTATTLLAVLVAAPLVALVVGSLRSSGDTWTLDNYRALTTTGEQQALLAPATEALATSLRTAVDATWMSLLLGLSVALIATRRSRSSAERRMRTAFDGLFMLPLGVSAVTLGFGFLVTLDEPPLDLRDSPLLVPVAQALVALPLVVRTLAPVLSSVDDRLRQAAATLGASPWRASLTVDLPVIGRPLLAAAGFAFAVSLGEFGATSFLARDEHATLPVVIFGLLSHPGPMNYGMALAASVVLAATTAGVMLVVERLHVPVGKLLMLSLRDVAVSYDGVPAVLDVDLELPDGQVLAVLGPSGCGKSTLLRAVAGLEPLSAGSVSWDAADLRGVPTHKRGFALLFQDGQLFPQLTVARNVGYALRLRRAPDTRARVEELLDLVGLTGYGARLPSTLSGGERQRVALARALAAQPRLLLLDEPLSALDAGLRERLAADLRDILRAAGTTALMVTHDHEEAFTVADRMAVMRAGRVVQEGPIAEVWREPADPETALFLGYARVFRGAAAATILAAAGRPPAPAVAVRRSALTVDPEGSLTGTVLASRATPEQIRLVVEVAGVGEADAVAPLGAHPAVGQPVPLRVDPGRLAIWASAPAAPSLD